jgi:thiamine biosynthesis lipoprotein
MIRRVLLRAPAVNLKAVQFILLLLGLTLYPSSCWATDVSVKRTEFIMGTFVEITVVSPDEEKSEEAVRAAFNEIKNIDALMSSNKEDSEVCRLNRLGELEVSTETSEVIKESIRFSKLSEGAFDITYKPLMNVWRKAEKENRLPEKGEIEEGIELVGYEEIEVEKNVIRFKKPGMQIDLSCIAKGYAVDKAIAVLKRMGITRALINAGGDMYALGEITEGKKWRIGIQHPREGESLIAVIELKDKAIATSGDYERYFTIKGKKYSYIFNPKTGKTQENTPMSVTVVASDCKTADALSTTSFILGPEKGIELIDVLSDVEGLIVSKNRKEVLSQGFDEFLVE